MPGKNPREFDLIEWIRHNPQNLPPSVLMPIGDDCAVFDPRFASRMTVTTDVLLEDVHFRRRWVSSYWLGRKSLVVNLSDLAAMGSQPYACLLNLALPGDLTGNYFHSFLKGFLEEAERWRTPLLGGDLSNSEKVYVSITAWGSFKEDRHPVYRSGGQVDDTLILIGDVGFSRLGLEILQQEDPDRLWEITDEETLASWSGDAFRFRCLKAHLLPSPLIPVGIWLCENGLANSMIDVSDGLATDLLHLACESQVEAEIQIDRLVLPEHNINQLSALEAALNGGEDYALLLSASPEQVERLSATYPSHFPPHRMIGKLSQGKPAVYLKQKDERQPYEPSGFDHFK